MLQELIDLAVGIQAITLSEGQPDAITWRFTPHGQYTARLAYLLQIACSISLDVAVNTWRGWAPEKCRFFMWTVTLGRILTADALLRRGWDNNYVCPICLRNLETPVHLLIECPWSRRIWEVVAERANATSLCPTSWTELRSINDRLRKCWSAAEGNRRKATNSLLLLTAWEIWKERNRRIFKKEELPVEALLSKIREEISLWNLAGANIPFDPG